MNGEYSPIGNGGNMDGFSLSSITDWKFLNEPLYRWVLFFIALTLISIAWRGVIEFMKA